MSIPTRRGPSPAALVRLLSLIFALGLAACSSGEDGGGAADAAPPATAKTDAGDAAATSTASTGAASRTVKTSSAKGEKAARHPNERPIPAFEGRTTAGTGLAMRDLLGRRVVFFFFNPEVEASVPVGAAVAEAHAIAAENNFAVVGVGVGSSASKLTRFVDEQGYAFPVIDDSSGEITRLLRLRSPVALLGVDADGYLTFGIGAFPPGDEAGPFARDQLRSSLRLPAGDAEVDGALYAWPEAPALGVVSMSDGKKLETADLAGQAAIIIFFLHTCPHCHHALEAIEKLMEGLPEDKQPRLVAVSVQNAPSAIRRALAAEGLDFFDPYLDPGGDATERWGVTGGVPVVNVVDAEGRIRHRIQGWDERRDAGMLRMNVARAVGARVPMLLDPKGYTGNDACGVCHEQEYATWQYTAHSTAFDTLVTHSADRRTDCIGCHVVGYEEPGGYDFTRRPGHLENVGCESCHGRGGPHLSPGFVPRREDGAKDYVQVCRTCHNETHSLGFDYATFHPRVSHTRLASLSNAERAALVEGGGPQRELLPTSADYVGSDACQSCHAKEYETWAGGAHGHAVDTLVKAGKAEDTDCLACHTTAYGKPGGFPAGAPVAEHPDLARVGCESCHGPGGDHIGENAKRVGTILSLGDKCDSCVILKVCGSCHDDANDPGFEFEVEARIEAQRHGTIESAATREGRSAFHAPRSHDTLNVVNPVDAEAAAAIVGAHDRALLRHAFAARPAAPAASAAPPRPSRSPSGTATSDPDERS